MSYLYKYNYDDTIMIVKLKLLNLLKFKINAKCKYDSYVIIKRMKIMK